MDLSECVIKNQRELGHLFSAVTSGKDQRSNSSGGNSGGQGVSSLFKVDLSVPPSPDL